MSAKAPPVPSENQSHKGTGDEKANVAVQGSASSHGAPDPDKQGQQGNTKVNTTHQGHQQDR